MSTNTVTNSTLSAARKRDEMLEPYEWKRSRTVLRREGASNRPDLVDYAPLVKRLGGQVVKISPTSTQYVNPMDINLNYSDDDNPLALKVDFLLSFCDIVVGSKDGLQPVEKTVIDRCVRNVYRPYLADPDPARMPILQDLYDELLAQPETEAQRIAAALIIRERQRGVLFNRRVFTGAAQRTGLTRLEPVAVAFQVFNRFFPLAERLQVEIVLVFVFILFPAQRQGSVKFYLLRLRLLDAVGVLAQTLAQQLMLLMQGDQALAQRPRLGLLFYRCGNVIRAQGERAGWQRGQLLA